MKRKDFIKTTSVVVAGGLIAPLASCYSENGKNAKSSIF